MGIVVVAVDRAPESWVKRIRTKVDERCQKVPWPIGEQPLKAAARASIAEKHLHVDSIECWAKSLPVRLPWVRAWRRVGIAPLLGWVCFRRAGRANEIGLESAVFWENGSISRKAHNPELTHHNGPQNV